MISRNELRRHLGERVIVSTGGTVWHGTLHAVSCGLAILKDPAVWNNGALTSADGLIVISLEHADYLQLPNAHTTTLQGGTR